MQRRRTKPPIRQRTTKRSPKQATVTKPTKQLNAKVAALARGLFFIAVI